MSELNIDSWKNAKFNVAVIGEPSSVKKHFIEKLAGFSFAENITGFTVIEKPHKSNQTIETVQQQYTSHINNTNFLIWDLQELADADASIEKYDLFILFCVDGYSENEIEIAKELTQRKKSVYFVKYENLKQDNLSVSDIIQPNMFIITADDQESQSVLSKLSLEIFKNLSDNDKKNLFIFSIEPITKEILETKMSILTERAHHVAIKSVVSGRWLTFGGLTIFADIALIAFEIWFYREQMGLNNYKWLSQMKSLSSEACKKMSKIISESKFASFISLNDLHLFTDLILNAMLLIAESSLVEFAVLPLFQAALHHSKSFARNKLTLVSVLDEFYKVANDLQIFVNKKKSEDKEGK